MKERMVYSMETPEQVARQIAARVKQSRLMRKWKQSTLAAHAGVSLASLRRPEQTGQVSLKHLLRISFALGRLSDFETILVPPPANSIADLEAATAPQKPKRASTLRGE